MRKHFTGTLIFLFCTGYFVFTSCKKEYSCEGCLKANLPPIALAGPDQSVTLPTDSVLLDGTASSDPDGIISTWSWVKISGPASSNIISSSDSITKVSKLVAGTYEFVLSVTDNNGLVAKDTIIIVVNPANFINHSPVANAGPDQTITLPVDSIMLDGSASTDADNNITQYSWTKIAGPATFTIVNSSLAQAMLKGLAQGTYQFELTVTDIEGSSDKDTIVIIVQPAIIINHPPIAKAGPDQIIALPLNVVMLDGSASTDPDANNTIATYSWTKISGPSSYLISNSDAVKTQIEQLVEGVYLFELKVTDITGLFSTDTVQIWVRKPMQACTGCKIVFTSNRDGNAEIYTCEADGSNIVRLTYNPGVDDEPVWSPDHSRIAFSSNRSGSYELYIMNADGSNVMQKTFNGSYSQNPSWSPDGTKIAFSSFGNGSMGIWVVGISGGASQTLIQLPGYDVQPAWSPDGTKIAFVSDWAAYDFVYDVYQVNIDGTGFKTINDNSFSDAFDCLSPDWSPDGNKLSMIISKETGINQYQTQLGIMNADGSNKKSIASDAARWMRTSWAADGKKILYTSETSGLDVAWVAADGSSKGTIVTNGWNADW